ncbi:MAG: flagellar basal-body MS-ring/collar protein FliF [Parvularculaceae bacterium]
MNEFLGLIRSFGIARLGAIVGVTIGVAAALALITARIGEPSMTVLYADLDYRDAQTVVSRLEQDGVRHKLRESGARASILVPRDEASRLRLDFAADGLVFGSGVGYEIFDDDKTLGATTFQQNINRLRALEGELARTISSISGVRSARVHLVLPERELFERERERQTASASIVVDAPGKLDARTVRAIVNLAASAVPKLNPARITVLDGSGALLASGENGGDGVAAGVEERMLEAEARIRRTVEDMVGRIVGPENVRVQVAADMSLNRVSESQEIIDPDSQTVLSSTVIEESSNDRDPAGGRGVTVANALPGAAPVADNAPASTSASQRTEEVTNYEISKTVRNAVRDEGLVVKRLSVAVAINGATSADAETYAPRSQAELQRIEALVKSAIGFNTARGDQVEVVDIRFQPQPAIEPATAAAPQSSFNSDDIMRIGQLAALALIALALIVFVLRPMFAPAAGATAVQGAPAQIAGQGAAAGTPALAAPQESALEHKIDLAQVEGQVKASSVKKVTEIVKGHTDESAGILKNWIRGAA